jgi:hypothetical protein
MGASASVSLVTEEDDGCKDDAYVKVARVGGEEGKEGGWQDLDNSWREMEAEEDDNDEGVFYVNSFTGREGMREEEEFVYYPDVSPRREEEPERREEKGWWTLDPSWLESEEEDEEEVLYLNKILSEECSKGKEHKGVTPPASRPQEGEKEGRMITRHEMQ